MANGDRTVYGRGAEGAASSIIDPSTYQSDGGSGFVIEAESSVGQTVQFETVYGINDTSDNSGGPLAHDDAAFSWDPDVDRTIVTIKQAGLYTVSVSGIVAPVSDNAKDFYKTLLAHTGLTDLPMYDLQSIEDTHPNIVRVRYLPSGEVHLNFANLDYDLSVFNYVRLGLAPMFTLTGIEES